MISSTGLPGARGKRPATYLFEVMVACRFVILMPAPSKVSVPVSAPPGGREGDEGMDAPQGDAQGAGQIAVSPYH